MCYGRDPHHLYLPRTQQYIYLCIHLSIAGATTTTTRRPPQSRRRRRRHASARVSMFHFQPAF